MKKVTDIEYGKWKKFSHDLDTRIQKGSLSIKDLKRAIAPLIGQESPVSKFGPPLKEFQFTVPEDYVHDTQLKTFGRENKGKSSTYHYNDELADKNFKNVSYRLVAGKTYLVKFIPVLDRVSSEECLEEYKRQNSVLVGAQGITAFQERYPEYFPVGKCYLSFDERENLWEDADGSHRVPYVYRDSDCDWRFGLGDFGNDWVSDYVLVCFCEQTSES
jgi:hypothetical protein